MATVTYPGMEVRDWRSDLVGPGGTLKGTDALAYDQSWAGSFTRGMKREINGLQNIVASTTDPYRVPRADGLVGFTHATKEVWTSEEDTMYDETTQCCEAPSPADLTDTLKGLRADRKYNLKQAKRLSKRIAAAKAQDKRNRKNAALAVAQAKQQAADREFALEALRHIAGERNVNVVPPADRLNAATALIDYTGGI